MTILALSFIALNVSDVLLTQQLLPVGTEANPLLHCENWEMLKMGMAFIFAGAILLSGNKAIMRGVVVGMAIVVAWNISMLAISY